MKLSLSGTKQTEEKPSAGRGSASGTGKRRLIAAALAVLIAAGGGFWLWQRHKKASLDFAVEQLNLALAAGDTAALSRQVDFNALTGELADIWLQLKPAPEGTTYAAARRRLQDRMQHALHRAFVEPRRAQPAGDESEKVGQAGKDRTPETKTGPFQAVPPPAPDLPEDFVEQLTATPFRAVETADGREAAMTRISHPVLGLVVDLGLISETTAEGRRFVGTVDAQRTVRLWKERYDAHRLRREALFHARNADIRSLMHRHCLITACRIGTAKVEADGSVLIVLDLEGVNAGDEILRSAHLRCRLRDGAGNLVDELPLNFERRVKPTDGFRQYWNFSYESGTPQAQVLAREKSLSCTTEVRAVSLQNGRIVYPRPEDELDRRPPVQAAPLSGGGKKS